MTWVEFKEKMQQRGVTDDAPIGFIDVGFGEPHDIAVKFRADGEVCVTDA